LVKAKVFDIVLPWNCEPNRLLQPQLDDFLHHLTVTGGRVVHVAASNGVLVIFYESPGGDA